MIPAARRWWACAGAALWLSWSMVAWAQPAPREVSPRGLRIGSTVVLEISGDRLGDNVRLISSIPIASQQILAPSSAKKISIAVTLPNDLLPGIYAFRLADSKGVSPPFMLGVDRLRQLPFMENLESLPAALSGVIAGDQKLSVQFPGRRGEGISVDLETRRLGGAMKPIIRLLDANGKQIAYSAGREALEGDARFTTQLPADGVYRVELQDALFRAPPSPFRLKIGALLFADAVFPPELAADASADLEFFSLGAPWGLKASYTAGAVHPLIAASWRPETLTGVTAKIPVASTRQYLEAPRPDSSQPLDAGAAPVGIAGKLSTPQEIDRYVVAVTPGQKYRFDLRGARLRSPIDGYLVVRTEQGAELARFDDQPGVADPAAEVEAPQGAERLIVEVSDAQGRGGDGFIYHLQVTSLSSPSLSLVADTDLVLVPRGGVALLPVRLARRNYSGGVAFSLEALPEGVQLAAAEAPADAEIALVAFTAAPEAKSAAVSHLLGKSTVAETPIAAHASHPGPQSPAYDHQPELRRQFAVAVVDPAPISLVWDRADVDLLGDMRAIRCHLKATRRGNHPGKTRIRLVTSQLQPKKVIKENNQNKEVDDVERTLRLEGETVFEPGTSDIAVTLRVPADLPPRQWQIAFVADILGDNNAIVASAPCLPRTMKFSAP